MGSLTPDALSALTLQEPIFQNIKYYVSGDLPDKITELLNAGGAERTQYFSDFVTHLLCGQNPNDIELTEATDLYEIPVVTPHWVIACVRLSRLVSPTPYNPTRQQIFNNVVACSAKVSAEDAKKLYALITYHGGRFQTHLDSKCTHFICGATVGKKYAAAITLPTNKLKIVTPDWVVESVRSRIQVVAEVFHPKLLIIPQPPAPTRPESRISAITGFDFEEGIAKNEVPTQNSTEIKDDSTQALLDKLKQRMPWNHPPSAPIGSTQTSSSGPNQSSPTTVKTMTTQNVTHNLQKMQGSPMIQHQFSHTNAAASQIPTTQMSVLQQQHLQQQTQQMHQGMAQSQQGIVQAQHSIQQNQQVIQQVQQGMQHSQQVMQQNQQALQQNQQGLQQNQQGLQQNQQGMQQTQLHGLSAIQKQQQQLLQQRQFRMPMLHQNQNKTLQQQQVFHQQSTNSSVGQMNQSLQGQMQHLQGGQQFVQQSQSQNQTPTTTLSQAQQIQNISQMLSQSTNNMQRAQLNQQNVLKQGMLTNQQQQQQQAVQNIAQHLAQSTQNLQQSQMLSQQQLLTGSVQTQQSQTNLMQQQTVQSLGLNNQQQNLNTSGPGGLMVQSSQVQGNTAAPQAGPGQPAWRQQNIQMIQNAQGQHQIIRGPLVQTRNPQNQMILQQQLIQNQQGIMNAQQPSPQHTVQASSQQIIQQNINSQGQAQHQILVQKQQIINGGQQQIVHAPQQVLINQHSGQQQIVVHGNQHVTLQGGQQIVSQQMMGQGGQLLTQGGQHLVAQGSQHQVLIAQSSQQMVSQGQGGPQIVQQQVLSSGGAPVHQIITHGGGQQLVSPGGQQLVQGQSISWQQQQYLQQRQQIAQPNTPRVSWAAGGGGRQLIHLDAQTHAQLQQMDPKQRALFVAQLQKRRQLSLQRSAIQQQQQQAGNAGGVAGAGAPSPAGTAQSVTFIRGKIPPGLTQQQQVQWLQQQGARATTLPVTPPAQPPQSPGGGGVAGAGGSAPAGGGGPVESQLQQLHLQRQQHYQRLQQLQAQREHVIAQHHSKPQAGVGVAGVARTPAAGGAVLTDATDALIASAGTAQDHQQGSGGLIVNPKTKTALANMLSIRLQSTGAPPASPAPDHEPSAAGTLRLMTAAHAAAAGSPARQPPARLLLHPAPLHTPHPAPPTPGKAYAPVRAPPVRSQFYGHNPNLKLPPDLFLLGCVFHIVEYQQSCGAERVARWTEAVGRRGGEVEPAYCARVTHVLCETQKHGVVMQALRDAKRCVTAYWLSDAMSRRAVAPPWQALHLPTMYAARDRPARHHRAALTGWRAEERDKVTFMVEHVGAKLTPYMSKDNTVLVCKRPEGQKYRKAREWGIPVVSALWLTDLLLGNTSALAQIENTKYQQFNLGSPFRMDYALVSHLMNAWKMPINITQESHERAKRTLPAPARRAKRPRLEQPASEDAAQAAPGAAQAAPSVAPIPLAPRVLFSATSPKQLSKLSLVVRQLGGIVVSEAAEATHLVMARLVRTAKLVCALVTVKHLLRVGWLDESARLGRFADEAQYALRDPDFERAHKCDLSEVLLCGEQRRKLLDGVTFFLTPSVQPSRALLTTLIELCGGSVERSRRSYAWVSERQRARPHSYLVLAARDDLHLVHYLLQPGRAPGVVCGAELVMAAVLRQRLDVQEFLVDADKQ